MQGLCFFQVFSRAWFLDVVRALDVPLCMKPVDSCRNSADVLYDRPFSRRNHANLCIEPCAWSVVKDAALLLKRRFIAASFPIRHARRASPAMRPGVRKVH